MNKLTFKKIEEISAIISAMSTKVYMAKETSSLIDSLFSKPEHFGLEKQEVGSKELFRASPKEIFEESFINSVEYWPGWASLPKPPTFVVKEPVEVEMTKDLCNKFYRTLINDFKFLHDNAEKMVSYTSGPPLYINDDLPESFSFCFTDKISRYHYSMEAVIYIMFRQIFDTSENIVYDQTKYLNFDNHPAFIYNYKKLLGDIFKQIKAPLHKSKFFTYYTFDMYSLLLLVLNKKYPTIFNLNKQIEDIFKSFYKLVDYFSTNRYFISIFEKNRDFLLILPSNYLVNNFLNFNWFKSTSDRRCYPVLKEEHIPKGAGLTNKETFGYEDFLGKKESNYETTKRLLSLDFSFNYDGILTEIGD